MFARSTRSRRCTAWGGARRLESSHDLAGDRRLASSIGLGGVKRPPGATAPRTSGRSDSSGRIVARFRCSSAAGRAAGAGPPARLPADCRGCSASLPLGRHGRSLDSRRSDCAAASHGESFLRACRRPESQRPAARCGFIVAEHQERGGPFEGIGPLIGGLADAAPPLAEAVIQGLAKAGPRTGRSSSMPD